MTKNRLTLFATMLLCAPVLCLIVMLDGTESGVSAAPSSSRNGDSPRRPLRVGHPTFSSPHASPIAVHDGNVFVVNTPADTVDVIDGKTRKVRERINVGVDPVSVAVRPDGKEVWVSNHVSDSVSVIDNVAGSRTYLQVVATIQQFDAKTKATTFDEPVGIAFAGNDKAYVALSSENQIAVIDVAARKVTKRLNVTAQDPRAIAVHGDRLYVIPFESNNKTQLSGGAGDKIDGQLVTFDAWEHSIRHNNVLSLGHVVDIVKHPKVPDRDLYIFDTRTDELVEVVDTLGTLLYGLTVDSKGRIFIAQTDARNDANGRSGTQKHGLTELENRAFLNRITRVNLSEPNALASGPGDAARQEKPAANAVGSHVDFIDLEPLPPKHPGKDKALATPFAIQVTDDDSTLVVSAAGSDKLFTVDAASGDVLGRVDVGAVPRGIALANADGNEASHAWVLNAVANTVSLVDVSDATKLKVVETIELKDPTHPVVKRGRIAFNTAAASTTHTFSCASCHPDGHTDQLLWVLKTPIVTGGNQIMPRSTMPIRGLRDTAPYHWDGIPGDPYGGNNSANIRRSVPPNSSIDDPTSSARHLIDGSLATTMFMDGDKTINDEGKAGAFSAAERDDLATYLLSVPFPPAQRRAYTNKLSKRAEEGFKMFHIVGDAGGTPGGNLCGNCHRMPFSVSTNTPGTGMEAPTWRGAYDRFLILPQGRLNIVEFPFFKRVAEAGNDERSIWRFTWGGRQSFDSVWDMVLEGSTGFSGSFARQVTLNTSSVKEELTADLLQALEVAAAEGGIVLEGEGVFIEQGESKPIELQFDPEFRGGTYVSKARSREAFTREQLVKLAASGKFVGTFTGRHGENADVESPQPALWTLGSIHEQRGRQEFPIVHEGSKSMSLSGRNFDDYASIYVDGRRVSGAITVTEDEQEQVLIGLDTLPEAGMHMLQVQAENGLFSNDFIFHTAKTQEEAAELKRRLDEAHVDPRDALANAIARGDVDEVRQRLGRQARRINDRQRSSGSTPLSDAAFRGKLEIVKLLIQRGAKVNGTNTDGNTPLIAAAFMCRTEVVRFLLDKGASTSHKNNRRETVIDILSRPWNDELSGFYTGIGNSAGLKMDLDRIKEERPKIAKLLREHASDEKQ